MTRLRLIGFSLLALGAAALLVAGGLIYSLYGRSAVRLDLARESVATQGWLTEKFTQPDDLAFIPLTRYVARYAYINPEGVLRSGEQELGRAFYLRLPQAGDRLTVYHSSGNAEINAVDRGLAFPGALGLRAAAALIGLILGGACLGAGLRLLRAA